MVKMLTVNQPPCFFIDRLLAMCSSMSSSLRDNVHVSLSNLDGTIAGIALK
jgi:hypothetical protein